MVQYQDAVLDQVFSALADPTRRHVLESLGGGSLPVSALAAPHGMSLPGFLKHLRVLEEAGLIARSKEGRVVRCALSVAPMREAAAWMQRYEKFWTEKLGALVRYVHQQEASQTWHKPDTPKRPRLPSSAGSPSRRNRSGAPGPTRRR
jgi:DNA-binding transcriptional ArsR family regulator